MKHLHQNLPSHDINACFDAIEQDLAALLLESTDIPHALLEQHLKELDRITDAPDALRMHEHAHSMASFLATHGNRPFDADDRTQLSILLGHMRLRVVIDSLCRHGGEGALRALLIDDSRSATAVHAAVLRQSNVQVAVCYFPHLAIDLVDAFRPDIIVCDIYMPGRP
jgi:PleD family two-component response regulator